MTPITLSVVTITTPECSIIHSSVGSRNAVGSGCNDARIVNSTVSTATTTAITASANSTTSCRDMRRVSV